MKVYIANFGRANSSWPDCLKRSTIAVLDGVNTHPFWEKDDRNGYIAEAQRTYRSRVNRPVISPVASRWFNLNTVLRTSVNDLWIHREKDEIWWTISIDSPIEEAIIEDPFPVGGFSTVHISHKHCKPWSDRNRRGSPLRWKAIHPKARDLLFTEGTFQQLSSDNALYAQALIDGAGIEGWHDRPDWRAREERSRKGAVTIFNRQQITAARMAETAYATAMQSGQLSVTEKKDKRFAFASKFELEKHILELLEDQEGLCALTGLEMLHDGVDGAPELHCSLDRIDSSGHYERGNLQVVCKFANQWKGASDNEEFKRLIALIRGSGIPDTQ